MVQAAVFLGRILTLLCLLCVRSRERQRTGAVQDAGAQTGVRCSRSVLDCARPLALFHGHNGVRMPPRSWSFGF